MNRTPARSSRLLALGGLSAALMLPLSAQAEFSGNLGVASQYLYRGVTTTSSAVVFGGLDYLHDSGFYAGMWTSSVGDELGGVEYDLYGGYSGEAGALGYDIGYVYYAYTETPGDLNMGEAYLGLTLGDFGLTSHFGVGDHGWGRGKTRNRDNYFVASYAWNQFGAAVGYFDADEKAARYTHLDLSYTLYESLTFTLSKIVDQEDDDAHNDNLNVLVSYTFQF